MLERVVVIGAGIAGLCMALSLAGSGRELLLLEKDGPPPEGDAEAVFADWNRRGVGQLRHSHAFLARLRTIFKARHPALLEQLAEAGCREIGFVDMLPDALKADYRAAPGDSEMAVLTSRRTTLELVMRRYVEALPAVTIVSGVTVRELIIELLDGGQLHVVGARGERDGAPAEWRGDLTVDAAGRTSQAHEQILAAGGGVSENAEACGIVYFTRHYRLRLGIEEPARSKAPGTGDLGFIKYGLFPGDNRCFSITLAVPEIETGVRGAVVRPEVFDQICGLLPGLAPWTDTATAEPISKVFGMGDLKSRWRSFVTEDRRATLSFFAVGDSLLRANPLYGRGCSFAAIQADVLREVLDASADPAVRARVYATRLKAELGPYFDDMRAQDRASIRRAKTGLDPDYDPPLLARVLSSFFNDGVRIALRSDLDLLRAAIRDFHMMDRPGAWVRKPANMAKILRWWARGRQRNADLYPPPLGPNRVEMMRILGLDPRPAAG